ncbi:hypothetical protein ABK040_015690 [Willaertia magna]
MNENESAHPLPLTVDTDNFHISSLCYCSKPSIQREVCKKGQNQGRCFYLCKNKGCNFFRWCDYEEHCNNTNLQNVSKEVNNLTRIVESIQSNNISAQLDGTVALRKLLSDKNYPPIEEVVESGVLPSLVKFLYLEDYPHLQFESLWSISNITSGKSHHTEAVCKEGVVPVLIKLLKSSSIEVVEQSIWALCNIAGDSTKYRDIVLKMGAMQPILDIINNQPKQSVLRNASWTLSNLFRGKPRPTKCSVDIALHTLMQLLYNNNEEIIVGAIKAFSYYSDGPNDRIQDVIECGVPKVLGKLLLHTNTSITTPALRTIGNIASGDDKLTHSIVNDTVLQGLLQLLSSKKMVIRKEACWAISNIASGNREHIQSVINANILPKVIKMLSEEKDNRVKYEVLWIINNLFSDGSKDQIDYVITLECMLPIINILENCTDLKLLNLLLQTITSLLNSGNRIESNSINPYIECVEGCDGFEKVRLFSNHYNVDITILVTEILDYRNKMDL